MLSKIIRWLLPEPELSGYQPKPDGLAKGELPPPPEGACADSFKTINFPAGSAEQIRESMRELVNIENAK